MDTNGDIKGQTATNGDIALAVYIIFVVSNQNYQLSKLSTINY